MTPLFERCNCNVLSLSKAKHGDKAERGFVSSRLLDSDVGVIHGTDIQSRSSGLLILRRHHLAKSSDFTAEDQSPLLEKLMHHGARTIAYLLD